MKDLLQEAVRAASLTVAPENPRSEESVNRDQISDLASNILELGILTPLIGYHEGDAFMVVAGGRRARAIQSLIVGGDMLPDTAIPVIVIDREGAALAGAAEQLSHVRMTDLDELRVYGMAQYQSTSDAELASLLGKSEKAVSQRRAVLTLPEEILSEIFAGTITVDQGFGLTYFARNPEALAEAAAGCKNNPRTTLSDLRRAFERSQRDWNECSLSQIVTPEEYLAAGGEFQDDLFTDTRFILDMEILQDVAKKKAPSILRERFPDAAFIIAAPDGQAPARHWGIDNLTDEEEEEWHEMRFARYRHDEEEEPEWFARFAELEAKSERTFPEALTAMLGVAYVVKTWGSDPIQIFQHVLPEDLEPLYAAGYLERPVEEVIDPDAPEESAPEAGLTQRTRDEIDSIRIHVAQMCMIKDPNLAMRTYIESINSDRYVMPTYSATPDRKHAAGMEGLEMSKQWEKALENDMARGEALAALSPADLRSLVALKMLKCMTTRFDTTPYTDQIRGYFTPDVEFMKLYRKPQLMQMAIEAGLLEADVPPEKFKTQALAEMLAHHAVKFGDWLPLGF